MAKLSNLTSFSGKVGDVVAYELNGRTYLRKKPIRRAPLTPAQRTQVSTFVMVQKWINPISPFLRLGYRGARPRMHALNAAKSVIHQEAVARGEDLRVLPELVRVSTGILPLPPSLEVFLVNGTELVFLWEAEVPPTAGAQDRIMMLAYDPVSGAAIKETAGPQRTAGTASLLLESAPNGSYHTYAAFIAEDHSRQSESVYLGVVMVG